MTPEFQQVLPWLDRTWGRIRETEARAQQETIEQGHASLAQRGLGQSGAVLTMVREATNDATRRIAKAWLDSLASMLAFSRNRRKLNSGRGDVWTSARG